MLPSTAAPRLWAALAITVALLQFCCTLPGGRECLGVVTHPDLLTGVQLGAVTSEGKAMAKPR